MVTDAGEIVTLDVSLLDRLTVTPPAGAADGRVTFNAVDWPSPTLLLAGTPIVPGLTTVTDAVAFDMFDAVAVMVADPGATPVTGTFTVVALAATVTLAGTLAAAVLLEFNVTGIPPAGAGPESVRVMFSVEVPTMLNGPGAKVRVPVTCTVPVPDVYPDADAVIVAD